jgi:hypothetical protein
VDFGKGDIHKIGKSPSGFVVLIEEVGKAECPLSVGKEQRSRAKPFIPIWEVHAMRVVALTARTNGMRETKTSVIRIIFQSI